MVVEAFLQSARKLAFLAYFVCLKFVLLRCLAEDLSMSQDYLLFVNTGLIVR